MPKRFKLVLCFLLSLLLLSGCVTLEKAKANAIQELSSYVDLADYLENARLQIQGIIDDAQSAIEEAGSKAEVDRIVTDAKTQINQILTKKALEEYQPMRLPSLINISKPKLTPWKTNKPSKKS